MRYRSPPARKYSSCLVMAKKCPESLLLPWAIKTEPSSVKEEKWDEGGVVVEKILTEIKVVFESRAISTRVAARCHSPRRRVSTL